MPQACASFFALLVFQTERGAFGALAAGHSATGAAHLDLGQGAVVLCLAVMGAAADGAFDAVVGIHYFHLHNKMGSVCPVFIKTIPVIVILPRDGIS